MLNKYSYKNIFKKSQNLEKNYLRYIAFLMWVKLSANFCLEFMNYEDIRKIFSRAKNSPLE